jgi:hypothetical protein
VDIVSSAEAKKLGLTHYFTGVPCKYSHVSVRQVSNRGCCQCLHERAMGWAKDNPVRTKEILTKWNEENQEYYKKYFEEYYKLNDKRNQK